MENSVPQDEFLTCDNRINDVLMMKMGSKSNSLFWEVFDAVFYVEYELPLNGI